MLDSKVLEELETQLSVPFETISNRNRKSESYKKFYSRRKKRRQIEKQSRRRNRR